MSTGQESQSQAGATVTLADLIQLRHRQLVEEKTGQQQTDDEYARAMDTFLAGHGGPETRLAVFGGSGLGAFLTPTGLFEWLVVENLLNFDWSKANQLLYRLDAHAEQAREWWPHRAPSAEIEQLAQTPQQSGRGSSRRSTRRLKRAQIHQEKESQRNDSERQPHLERAFLLLTGLFSAISRENDCHPKDQSDMKDDCSEGPTDLHLSNLRMLAEEIAQAEFRLKIAGQRNAQTYYGRGMLIGTGLVFVLCLALSGAFVLGDVSASIGVAVPAGALGALVSVLQRMTSGTLKLDFNAGRFMLTTYGVFRPLIGSIFGMVIFALFQSDVLPAVAGSEKEPLAFFAGVGFLAGFNERFAQDMLAGSAKLLSPPQDSSAAAGTAASHP